jgi:hypothetical protein
LVILVGFNSILESSTAMTPQLKYPHAIWSGGDGVGAAALMQVSGTNGAAIGCCSRVRPGC